MPTAPVQKIYRFGTSGYRNDQDSEFNEAVIRQITNAIADYMVEEIENRGQLLPILIGGDTREKTRRFIPLIAEILKGRGLDVFKAKTDVPSPVLAYAAKYFGELNLGYSETLGAILMTASHNPWPYGGYNFLTPDAAVMPTPVSKKFEEYQANPQNKTLDRTAFGGSGEAKITEFDPYELYRSHLKAGIKIDYPKIKASGLKIFYDPLYATGRRYLPRLLKDEGIDATVIHDTEQLPEGYTGMPEPTGSNLTELTALIQADKQDALKIGLANDGDADRFGILDENGRYLDANEVLSLIVYHLLNNKQQKGVIVRSQATTHLLDALAEKAGLPVIQTPVGYKYIAEEFIDHEKEGGLPVLIGGESSGGISVLGHIPEKDGILANLVMAELVATEGKPLSDILKNVQASVARKFAFRELGVKTERNQEIMAHFQTLQKQGGEIAGFKIDTAKSTQSSNALEQKYGTRDGAKVFFEDGSWILVRASGTEPIARVYVEGVSDTSEKAFAASQTLLDTLIGILTSDFAVSSANIKERK
ncbi:MAG: phosphoglucosamine mutase [Vampirovibrio sp.]|jgi:phosphomannomutase|nr:phosphoglucosamine mutase [Vampirovibrio sp.]